MDTGYTGYQTADTRHWIYWIYWILETRHCIYWIYWILEAPRFEITCPGEGLILVPRGRQTNIVNKIPGYQTPGYQDTNLKPVSSQPGGP